jgi:hypothetical protein
LKLKDINGKADADFLNRLGIILTRERPAVHANEEDLAYIREHFPEGVTVAFYTNFPKRDDAHYRGDFVFKDKAEQFAAKHQAVSIATVDGDRIAIGFSAMPIQDVGEIAEGIQRIHHALIKLFRASAGACTDTVPAFTRVKNLAIFTHGMEYGLDTDPASHVYADGLHSRALPLQRPKYPANVQAFVRSVIAAVSPEVRIQLYACNAAMDLERAEEPGQRRKMPEPGDRAGSQSFAGTLNQELHSQGAQGASVYGHIIKGHSTENPAARVFGKESGDACATGGAPMFDKLYPEEFIQAELHSLVPDYAAKSREAKEELHRFLRARMWEHFVDSTSKLEKGQSALQKPDQHDFKHGVIGMEMFMDAKEAGRMLREDWARNWVPHIIEALLKMGRATAAAKEST